MSNHPPQQPKRPYEFTTMLTLSTGHVPKSEVPVVEQLATWTSECGWMVYADPDEGSVAAAPHLKALCVLARQLGHWWLHLDENGQQREDLPYFLW